jgi:hypothetical protein
MAAHAPRTLSVSLALLLAGCTSTGRAPSPRQGNAVQITARGLTFTAPDEIPSGWTTFRFSNETTMVHFAVVERMPEGYGIKEHQEQLAPVFQAGMTLLNAGKTEAAMKTFGELPDWFHQVVFEGGPGLTAPGTTSLTTLYLEPGTYLLECYVKTAGVFHSSPTQAGYGMVHQFRVTDTASGAPEPTATLDLTLSSTRGIEIHGSPRPGEQTIAIHFEDQTLHENFVGHDVHLARLAPDTDLDQVASWMDWRQPFGLQTPAPVQFLGGTEEMPAGKTAYFTASLAPGAYAWISEVPDTGSKRMLQTFTVAEEEARLQ